MKQQRIRFYSSYKQLLSHPSSNKKNSSFQITDVESGESYFCWAYGYKDALYALVRASNRYKVKRLKGNSSDTDKVIEKIVAKVGKLTEEERAKLLEKLQD